MGNGLANIVAAAIVALAILWNGGFAGKSQQSPAGQAISDDEFQKLYARAVGDIRNDIVVNCGCCGDEKTEGRRRASDSSF